MSSSPDDGRPLKVLHVDDDAMNLRVVQEILGAFGHQAVTAASGMEALERLSVEAFDVVLLDIHMPGMTGLDVIERLRGSKGPEREFPVIALTADVYSRRPSEYLALGFDDFVAKPILVSSLMTSLRRCSKLRRPEPLSRAS